MALNRGKETERETETAGKPVSVSLSVSMISLFIFFTLIFSASSAWAQTYTWLVRFTDKNNSTYSITQPEQFLSPRAIDRRARFNIPISVQDLPVNQTYLDALEAEGAVVRFSLRWMNAAVIEADNATMADINNLSFVDASDRTNRTSARLTARQDVFHAGSPTANVNSDSVGGFYGYAFQQNKMIGTELLHERNFHGEGMLIAVMDAGFKNYTSLPAFQPLVNRGAFVMTYDVVGSDHTLDDTGEHGIGVLSILAAYDPGKMVGPAYMADFLLFRTENEFSESPQEELNWARAAEMADSAGADIIQSSLGYFTFDNSTYDYDYTDMDGVSTYITQAANTAGGKGILVVSSCGNEGTGTWHYITAPSDGAYVLSVGASNKAYQAASFSSYGPTYDGRRKPDISAQGADAYAATSGGGYAQGSGTSYAAPLISGLAACIWQAHPELTNLQLMQLLREAGHLYPSYHEQLGYGIPDYHRVRFQLENGFSSPSCILAPNPVQQGNWVEIYLSQPFRNISTMVRIYDAMGREHADYTFVPDQVKESLRLNTDFLAPGMYTVELITNSTVNRLKFQVY